ncbi:response regulator transcription factor [Tepidibacillus fermentans]|uniref:Two-component system alkaline phosphatase synthesis response regulator PhoP n=1 Tax=Tepidibacillus fermentans TaxID=1281767 RepID=A0A4R3KIX1_9BACI|nr:response regulator transcription factor [Tepidibacillus fermentans]TCS83567.1 two-component system alkaline phosphatase synthesis response regulator PhoP [Tepidibacillus fermentans]
MAKKILVVDDEPSIVTLVKFNLEKAGFDVETVSDGRQAVERCERVQYDLMVLDVMLPELDGLEVVKELKKKQINIPILMLTAKDDEFDKVLGLELGADDYMTKPFSPRELTARVKAVLRRFSVTPTYVEEEISEKIVIGDLVVEPEKFEARLKGELLEFTPKEFELLLYLAKNQGKVLTRDQLLNAVWNYDYIGDSRIVDVHISHLREKIEEDTKQPKYIKTVRGIGYKFGDPQK